ncbi:MAG TPA: hypothetical protein VNO50_09005 [Pyrinomonadaceae bacterium]|nr:hypothetical protein [Pyrinomonadaceae bacterium]
MAHPNEPDRSSQPENESEMSEAEIDRNLADTFPASDPPSWTLGTDHKPTTPTKQPEPPDQPEEEVEE